MRKTSLIFKILTFSIAGLFVLSGCEVTECGDDVCEGSENHESCPEDCGPCGDGICEGDETTANCPADCGGAGGAQVQFTWYIHGVQGGVDVGWGSGEVQEVCALVQDLSGISAPPVVQLWIETTGDDTADQRFDFTCSAGTGLTTEEWQSGESLKYAFALVDGAGTLLSQSMAWETTALTGGVNDFGTVNLYIGEYGPLGVEIQWADKEADPAFGDCDSPPDSVTNMGYLLCWGPLSAGSCPSGMLYDEIEIDVSPIDCRTELAWDIIDYGTYTLVLDGEDAAGATVWGSECQDLVVDSMEPSSNEFTCQVLMTSSP